MNPAFRWWCQDAPAQTYNCVSNELLQRPSGIRSAAQGDFVTEQTRILGKRILLVEDDQGARDAIKLLLTIDRHDVVAAAGGVEGIELLRNQHFDLAILDYFMPEMQGNQVALRFKEMRPSLPILMVTAYLEKLTASEIPVDALMGKPFAIEDLRRNIAKLVS
jgi:CheY-like chemotaxis protein